MSSGQWEVVGKNKKNQNGKIKGNKNDDKKSQTNGPKLEDLVPNSQLKTLYDDVGVEAAQKPKKPPKKNDAEKKQAKKQPEKKPEQPKVKPPKTIEAAVKQIDPKQLDDVITTNKLRFSNAPLVWLKEVAIFLNSKIQIDVDDPTFANYPSSYPVSVLPADIKKSLKEVLHDAGKVNSQLFFDNTLTALANDMSRAQAVNGHRILLQLLAQTYPEFCVASIAKCSSLRSSYQNRPPIGLSLLWAFGQGGLYDFSVGLQVWQELFLPIIALKSYTKYIITYLSKMLELHALNDATKLNHEKLLTVFDQVNSKTSTLNKDQAADLINQLSKLKDIYFNQVTGKLQVTFNQLMKKLPNQVLSGTTLDPFNRVIVQCLVDCLHKDDTCHASWRQLFQRGSKQCATLLEYINNNWVEVSPKLKKKSLKNTLDQYKQICNEGIKGKKKDETLVRSNKLIEDILGKMTSSSRRFPWFWASFFLLISIGGLVSYDVSRVKGDFPQSATGKFLKDLGLLEQSQLAWQKTLSTSARGYLWLETNTPIYYTQAVEFSKPYVELSRDLCIVGAKKAGILYGNVKDYVVEKTPVVVATIEQYAPGLVDNVQSYSIAGWTAVKKYSSDYYGLTSDYLKTKVFVGEWAPEILQNKTESALNVTRSHVSSYFSWFREQVNVYSKIP